MGRRGGGMGYPPSSPCDHDCLMCEVWRKLWTEKRSVTDVLCDTVIRSCNTFIAELLKQQQILILYVQTGEGRKAESPTYHTLTKVYHIYTKTHTPHNTNTYSSGKCYQKYK